MKWVRRIFMFLLILAIAGCGVLAFLNFRDWSDAKEELDEVKAENFISDEEGVGFAPDENQKSVAFILCVAEDGSGYFGSYQKISVFFRPLVQSLLPGFAYCFRIFAHR